jgi:hypothetical protein
MLQKTEFTDEKGNESRIYRFEHHLFTYVITVPIMKARIYGVAVLQNEMDAIVVSLENKRRMPSEELLDVAKMFGDLNRAISINYAINMLEDE